jgi:hypothetical protein
MFSGVGGGYFLNNEFGTSGTRASPVLEKRRLYSSIRCVQ